MKPHNFNHFFVSVPMSVVLFFVFFCTNTSAATESSAPDLKDSVWTWAEKSDDQHAIFISRHTGEKWEQPIKVSNNQSLNVVPSVTVTTTGDLWLVWSAFDGQQSILIYKRLIDGSWTEETSFYTGLSSNTAPSIGIDDTGKVWLVWAGFDGISDEIFFSTWNGSAFEPGIPLTSNDVPDVLPVLGFADEKPWIHWQKFKESGYVEYQSSWTGSNWTEPVPTVVVRPSEPQTTTTPEQISTTATKRLTKTVFTQPEQQVTTKAGSTNARKTNLREERLEIELPPFITDPDSASIHIPGYEVQSLPVRNMGIIQ